MYRFKFLLSFSYENNLLGNFSFSLTSIFRMVLIIVLIIHQFGLAQTVEPENTPTFEQNFQLSFAKKGNLRLNPSLSAKIIGIVEPGQTATLLSRKDDWLFVKLSDNQCGWVNQLLLAHVPQFKFSQGVFYPSRTFALHAGPGENYQIFSKIFPLQHANIIKIFQGWWQIQTDRLIGWIKDIENNKAIPEDFYYGVLYIAKSGNLRQFPSTGADISGKVFPGDSLEVIGIWQDWYHIIYNQNSAYVNVILVDTNRISPRPFSFVKVIKSGYLRSYPDFNAAVIGNTQLGQFGYLFEQKKPWNRVFFAPATIAYVHDILIETLNTPQVFFQEQHIKGVAELIKQANQLRREKKYKPAINYYLKADSLIQDLKDLDINPACYNLYKAEIQYLLSEKPIDLSKQKDKSFSPLLQSVSDKTPCFTDIQAALERWHQGYEFRNKLLALFTEKGTLAQTLEEQLNRSPEIIPLVTEAEAGYFLGHYYTNYQRNIEKAITWQKKSGTIYQALYQANCLNQTEHLDNYFAVLLELAESYINVQKRNTSMAVLDEAYKLIQQKHRNDWLKRYLKVYNLVTDIKY